VLPRLYKYNKKHALRAGDIVDLQLKSQPLKRKHGVVSGTGQWKKLTPATILRVSFGRGWTPSLRKRVARKRAVDRLRPGKTPRNVQASSTAAVADFTEAGGTHISATRAAVALKYCTEVSKYVARMPHARLGIIKLHFDESEQGATIDKDAATYSMMMIAVTLTMPSPPRSVHFTISLSATWLPCPRAAIS
jgi:hypothetical protein